jgi:gliding motility-associated-like protein
MTNLTWTDNCDGTGNVTGTDVPLNGTTCGGTITRTWTYTDLCGNVATATQIITIDDNINPTFAAAPAAITVSCISAVPAMTNLTWTDNCDGTGNVTGTDVPLNGTTCGGTITRTWTYTDLCGNVATATQIITIDDNINPTFAAAPAAITVSCISAVPAMTNLTWTDNCDGTGNVTGTDVPLNGTTCGGTITRTWTYTDLCGNVATATQIITIDDNINPTFAAAPAAITVSCISAVPAMTNLTWTDNCDGTGNVTGTDVPLNGTTCGGTITRTWTYTDLCGNVATATQIITIDDNINPTFAAAPAAITVSCISAVPAMTNLTWTDNCDGTGNVTGTDAPLNGTTCGGTITRTWTYTDLCGNVATATQIITIDDNINPTFAAAPAAITVSCISAVPAMTNLTWTDNCDGTGNVTGTDAPLNGTTCGGTITRTWTYTDLCGNVATATQIITIDDNINPTFAAAPAAITVSCISAVPAMTNLTWTDNCDGTGNVTGTDAPLNGTTCGGTITRTWTYTDLCGNAATATQIITIDDNIAPTGTAPANIVVYCPSDVPAPNINLVTNVNDNCGVPIVTFVSDISDNNFCNGEIITRTYAITDVCGNEILVSQTITISVLTPIAFISSTNPTTCGGQDGTISLSNLTPNYAYNVSINGSTTAYTSNGAGVITIGGLNQGTYSGFVVVSAACASCPQVLQNQITLIDPTPPVINAGQDITICFGESVTLTAQNPNNAQIVWSGGIQNGIAFVPPVGTNIYTVTATLNNCISSDDVVVFVNPLPNVNAGADQNVCEGSQVTLTASGAVSYQWNNGVINGVPFTQLVPQQTYTVIGTDANGCQNQDQVTVNMLSNPLPSFTMSDTLSCFSPFEVIFQNTTVGSSAVCFWNFGNGQTSNNCDGGIAVYNDLGCYNISLNITYSNGCQNSFVDYNAICVSSPPTAAFTANPSSTDVGMPINFINHSEGAVTYVWDFGDGALITQPNAVYEYTEGGNFNVMLIAINEFGCSDTTYQTVLIKNPLLFYVPNTFTPGDGGDYNNIFIPVMTSGFDPWDYELTIFNRWGEIIFVSRHPNKGWDGTYGDKACPDGTYIWQINVRNADGILEMHRGHVNLLR